MSLFHALDSVIKGEGVRILGIQEPFLSNASKDVSDAFGGSVKDQENSQAPVQS